MHSHGKFLNTPLACILPLLRHVFCSKGQSWIALTAICGKLTCKPMPVLLGFLSKQLPLAKLLYSHICSNSKHPVSRVHRFFKPSSSKCKMKKHKTKAKQKQQKKKKKHVLPCFRKASSVPPIYSRTLHAQNEPRTFTGDYARSHKQLSWKARSASLHPQRKAVSLENQSSAPPKSLQCFRSGF